MRLALFILAVFIPGAMLLGQGEAWMEVPDASTGVSVEMPGLPVFEKKAVYRDSRYVDRDIFSFSDSRFELAFESEPLQDTDKKTVSRSADRIIEMLKLRLGGVVSKTEELKRDGLNFRYVELSLPNGEVSRSVLFSDEGKIYHLYVKAAAGSAFGIDANRFLGSWERGFAYRGLPDPNETDLEAEVTVTGSPDHNDVETESWVTVRVNDFIQADFPGKPFKRTTLVRFASKEVRVVAFSRHSPEKNMNYVLTYRAFNTEEGQLDDDDLYGFILGQIIGKNRLKLIREDDVELNEFEAKEYLFSRGIRFYKLRMFSMDDTLYQSLVKGKRRNINQMEAARFFNSIKPLD